MSKGHSGKREGAGRKAKSMHLAAAVVFPIGIAMVTVVDHSYEFLAIIGSLIFLAAMLLFTVVVYRTS